MRTDEPWSVIVSKDTTTYPLYAVRWGNDWASGSALNFQSDATYVSKLTFYWHQCTSVSVPLYDDADVSVAITFDPALYNGVGTDFTALGAQQPSSPIQMYSKVGDGAWTQPEIVSYSLSTDCASGGAGAQTPTHSQIKVVYYSSGTVEGFELYNEVLHLGAPPPPPPAPPGAVAVYAWDGASSWELKGAAPAGADASSARRWR